MDRDAYNIKRVRGHILSGLQSFYPNGVSGALIHRDFVEALFPTLEWVQTLQQLDYLREKSFVMVVPDPFDRTPSARKKLFRLTAVGLDVASGVVEDTGIEVEL